MGSLFSSSTATETDGADLDVDSVGADLVVDSVGGADADVVATESAMAIDPATVQEMRNNLEEFERQERERKEREVREKEQLFATEQQEKRMHVMEFIKNKWLDVTRKGKNKIIVTYESCDVNYTCHEACRRGAHRELRVNNQLVTEGLSASSLHVLSSLIRAAYAPPLFTVQRDLDQVPDNNGVYYKFALHITFNKD